MKIALFSFFLVILHPPFCNAQDWRWFTKNPKADTMCIELTLRDSTIFKAFFPISAESHEEDNLLFKKVLEFSFVAECNIFNTGEDIGRDAMYDDFGKQRIVGNICQAGTAPDGILFGLDFFVKDYSILNTIKIAKHDYVCKNKIADGLSFKTYLISKDQKIWEDKKEK
jgi:hypothetical protein